MMAHRKKKSGAAYAKGKMEKKAFAQFSYP